MELSLDGGEVARDGAGGRVYFNHAAADREFMTEREERRRPIVEDSPRDSVEPHTTDASMTSTNPPPSDQRFRPHAAREMAEMFDDVSARYDVLNRLMTLGRDTAWREAM